MEDLILTAIRHRVVPAVNEILDGEDEGRGQAPPFLEFEACFGSGTVRPEVSVLSCERNKKERIVQVDAYLVEIVIETTDEVAGFRYAAAFDEALAGNSTMGGVADRAVIVGKKYSPVDVVLTVRVTVEAVR
ncbi:MAG: hypothetical protein LBM77_00435 [Spirochaetaceae bacterium]|nr:hypothetical protein [Spirochaetaceae bacterium]